MGKVVVGRSSSGITAAMHGTVAITGGMGALGCLVAGWLARQGSRRLLLLGRRGRMGNKDAALNLLRQPHCPAYGALVTMQMADVSTEVTSLSKSTRSVLIIDIRATSTQHLHGQRKTRSVQGCATRPVDLYVAQHTRPGCVRQEAGYRCCAARPDAAPELTAVIHAGGVLMDAALANQSSGSMREAAAAKGVAVAKHGGRLRCYPLATQVRMPRL